MTSADARPERGPESRRSDGLFAHHGLWAPGVRLFRRVRFRAKAAMIGLVLALPLLVASGAVIRDLQQKLETIRSERQGVDAMGRFVPVLRGLLETRNATRASLGGLDASGDYRQARQATDAALDTLARDVRVAGIRLQ